MMKDSIEVKNIKVSVKRQISIPKSMMEELDNPEKFRVTLTESGLFLKPIYPKEETLDELNRRKPSY